MHIPFPAFDNCSFFFHVYSTFVWLKYFEVKYRRPHTNITSKHLTVNLIKSKGWEVAQSVKRLPCLTKTQGPALELKLDERKEGYKHTIKEMEMGGPWGCLASQPSLLGKLQANETLTSKTRWMVLRNSI